MYYVRIRGKTLGPLEEKQVVHLVRQGKLGRMNEISTDQRQWVRADEFEQFFPKPQPAIPPTAGPSKPPHLDATHLPKDKTQEVETRHTTAESPTTAWYYSEDGKTGAGPFPPGDIEQMIRKGKIIGQTILWNDHIDPQTAETTAEFARYFRKSSKPIARRNRKGSPWHQAPDDAPGRHGTLSPDLLEQLEKAAAWSLVLALMGTTSAAILLIAQLFLFVIVVQTGSAPLTLGFLLVMLVVDMLSGYMILVLWRCTSQWKRTLREADDVSLILATKRMAEFWRACVLTPIVLCVFMLLIALSALTAGRNTFPSSYNDMMRPWRGKPSMDIYDSTFPEPWETKSP